MGAATCVKVAYPNQERAQAAALTAARVTWELHHRREKVLRAYPCPKCRQWHLTSTRATVYQESA